MNTNTVVKDFFNKHNKKDLYNDTTFEKVEKAAKIFAETFEATDDELMIFLEDRYVIDHLEVKIKKQL